MKHKRLLTWITLLIMAGNAQAAIEDVPCALILQVWNAIRAVSATLVVMMFTYGGVRYVFSADDAGGRKAAKQICQHAIIGGIMLSLVSTIMTTIGITGGTYLCTGITP